MKYETVTLLTPKIRFLMLMLCPVSLSLLSLKYRGKGGVYFCYSLLTHTPGWLGIFAWKQTTSAHSSLKSEI